MVNPSLIRCYFWSFYVFTCQNPILTISVTRPLNTFDICSPFQPKIQTNIGSKLFRFPDWENKGRYKQNAIFQSLGETCLRNTMSIDCCHNTRQLPEKLDQKSIQKSEKYCLIFHWSVIASIRFVSLWSLGALAVKHNETRLSCSIVP